jgi:hypothetical protein
VQKRNDVTDTTILTHIRPSPADAPRGCGKGVNTWDPRRPVREEGERTCENASARPLMRDKHGLCEPTSASCWRQRASASGVSEAVLVRNDERDISSL